MDFLRLEGAEYRARMPQLKEFGKGALIAVLAGVPLLVIYYLWQGGEVPDISPEILDPFIAILTILAILGWYFFPTRLAFKRKHHNATAICVLNILLGWTFLGWVAALVWACTSPPPASDTPRMTG